MTWNRIYILDILAICLFLLSYYRNCYRKGYRVDLWHFHLFTGCIFPYFVMMFFVRNELNAVIVGQDFAGIVEVAPTVFLFVLLGYLSIFAGGSLWSFHLGIGLRKTARRWLDAGPRCSLMLMSSTDLLMLLTGICFSLQMVLLVFYFSHDGFGFDLRAYTFAVPAARPFAQITALSSLIIASHCVARYVDTKEKILLACTVMLTLGLVFFGQRGNLVAIYINVGIFYLIKLRTRVSLVKVFLMVGGLVTVGLYLGNARAGIYSIGEFFSSLAFLFLYGNNFTDFRDFSWMYTDWNHQFWIGKTYLAGLATFIPRGASDFRTIWSFGIATGWTVGLDTDTHPGLKPGMFGESFFNFGLPGILFVGLLFGVILRRIDIDVKTAMSGPKPSMIHAFASTMLLSFVFCVTTSLNLPYLYALGGIYVFAWLYLQAKRLVLAKPTLQPDPG